MTDAKSAWHEASERFGSLGTKLKTHYAEQRGQEADQAKAEVKDALHRLSGALEDAFEALGKAAKDDAVKTDVKQVGQSLATALGATFTEVSGELQRTFAHRGARPGSTEPEAPATAEPSATTGPPATTEPAGPVTDAGAGSAAAGEPGETGPAPSGAATGPAESPLNHEPPAEGGGGEDEPKPPRVEPWGTP